MESKDVTVQIVQQEIEAHLNQLKRNFKPGMELTFIARKPDNDGAYFVVTNDKLAELAKVVERMQVRHGQESEAKGLRTEVERLRNELKLTHHRLKIETEANKSHVSHQQAMVADFTRLDHARISRMQELLDRDNERLTEIERLTIKSEAMHLVIAPLSVKADISEEKLLSLLAEAEQNVRPILATPFRSSTDGGARNPFYEGLFPGESEADRDERIKAAGQS